MSHVNANQPDGTPTWIDLGIPDLEGAMRFYGALFGWDFEVGPPEIPGPDMPEPGSPAPEDVPELPMPPIVPLGSIVPDWPMPPAVPPVVCAVATVGKASAAAAAITRMRMGTSPLMSAPNEPHGAGVPINTRLN